MATIGQALTSPETGWRRYDDTDSRIKYKGTWLLGTNSNNYGGSHSYSSSIGDSLIFKFYGTKLRVTSPINSPQSANIQITIDGVAYNFSEYSSTLIWSVLVFEKLNLSLGVHTIEIKSINSSAIALDSIDIDDTGYLMHPTLNQVSNVNGMQIGDCIPCRYTALTSGQPGYFSELGTCIANEIPVSGTATPNGLFYLICVGKDYQGKTKLIADRNIQHSISWDILNAAGIPNGIMVSSLSSPNTKIYARLMTGGISANDLDNEWDKIIANSDLRGKITPGDDSIWHWRGQSYTMVSTVMSTTNTARVLRGASSVNYSGGGTSSAAIAADGFRPLLLVDISTLFLIKKDNNYYSIKSDYYDVNSHSYLPLVLSGSTLPNSADIDNFGFDNINLLLTSMTKGSDTFKPIDKIPNNFEIRMYKTI
jgi:hypothetical protein